MITADQLQAALVAAGIPQDAIRIFGDSFECPKPSWVTGAFAAAWKDYLFSAEIGPRVGQMDCHRFAKGASWQADVCWYGTKREDAALAFGMFGMLYPPHMLNVAVHAAASGGFYVAHYEPQDFGRGYMREVILTEENIRSCTACFFF